MLLNDEMNDFAVGGPQANAYRLAGGAANAVAPGKRPLSSMTPTFLEDERGVLVFGTPGGSRIISMVLLSILEYVDGPQLDLERVVGAAALSSPVSAGPRAVRATPLRHGGGMGRGP